MQIYRGIYLDTSGKNAVIRWKDNNAVALSAEEGSLLSSSGESGLQRLVDCWNACADQYRPGKDN